MPSENSIAKKALSDAIKLLKRTDMSNLVGVQTSSVNRAPSFQTPEYSELGEYINDIYTKIFGIASALGIEYNDDGYITANGYSSHTHNYTEVTTTITTDAEGNTTSTTTTTTEITTGVN